MNALIYYFIFLSQHVYSQRTNRVGHHGQTRYQKASTPQNLYFPYLLQKPPAAHFFAFITSMAILIKKLSFKLKDDKSIGNAENRGDSRKQAQLMFYNL